MTPVHIKDTLAPQIQIYAHKIGHHGNGIKYTVLT